MSVYCLLRKLPLLWDEYKALSTVLCTAASSLQTDHQAALISLHLRLGSMCFPLFSMLASRWPSRIERS